VATFIKKEVKIALDRGLIEGLEKHFQKNDRIVLEGRSYTRPELTALLETRIALLERASSARLAWLQAVEDVRADQAKTDHVVSVLRQTLRLMHGARSSTLFDFAIEPHRVRRALSTDEKRAIIAKIRATRAARHTLGRRQRLAIRGEANEANRDAAVDVQAGESLPITGRS
jgi:hypothetical protein